MNQPFNTDISVMGRTEISIMESTYRNFSTYSPLQKFLKLKKQSLIFESGDKARSQKLDSYYTIVSFLVNQKNKIYQMTKKNFNNKTIPWIADKA